MKKRRAPRPGSVGPQQGPPDLEAEEWRKVELSGLPRLDLGYVRGPDGRPRCTRLVVQVDAGSEITASLLRSIPFREVASRAMWLTPVGAIAEGPHRPIGALTPDDQKAFRLSVGRWTPEHYQRIADNYREVLRFHPEAPTAHTAELFGVAVPTMRTWLRRTREAGYLPAWMFRPGRPAKQPIIDERGRRVRRKREARA